MRRQTTLGACLPEREQDFAVRADLEHLKSATGGFGIVAKGADFTLFINDQKVDQVKDTTLSSGRVGLVIETHGILPATFEFDNLELRRSPEAPGAPPAGK